MSGVAATLPGESLPADVLVARLRKVNADQARRIGQFENCEAENRRLKARLREVERVGTGQDRLGEGL